MSGRHRRPADVARTVLRGIGQTLITLGVVMLLFVVYTLWITNLFTARDQRALNSDLTQQWAAPAPTAPTATPPPTPLGKAFARLYLPEIGKGKRHPLAVVQGVGTASLKKGPGHLPTSALPGELGNVVISGHRTTYGAPFNRLDELHPGDPIVVETATRYVVYRMTGRQVVKPSAYEVTFPVPGEPGVRPTKRLLTLTTCNPKYSAKQRLIIRAELAEVVEKAGGALPAALQEA